jgi:hypothetical protein
MLLGVARGHLWRFSSDSLIQRWLGSNPYSCNTSSTGQEKLVMEIVSLCSWDVLFAHTCVQITLAMLNRSFLRATFAYKSGLLDNPPSQVMRILTTISFYFFFFQKVTNGYFINIKTTSTSFGFNLSFFFPFFFFFFFFG